MFSVVTPAFGRCLRSWSNSPSAGCYTASGLLREKSSIRPLPDHFSLSLPHEPP
jgi:hypothetical protein